jgi:hypothetical protein
VIDENNHFSPPMTRPPPRALRQYVEREQVGTIQDGRCNRIAWDYFHSPSHYSISLKVLGYIVVSSSAPSPSKGTIRVGFPVSGFLAR